MRGEKLGAYTGGVWTAVDARSAGIGDDVVARACASHGWQRLRRGVYLDGGVAAGVDHLAWAAVLAAGGPGRAMAVGRTAARLHGLPLVDDDDPVLRRYDGAHDDVAVERRLHRRATLHPRLWSYLPAERGLLLGCPVPSLVRTLWDLRLVLRQDALVCALDAALHERRVTVPELRDQLVRTPRARGALGFARCVQLSDARAESPLETLARLVLRPVLSELEPQIEVYDTTLRMLARIDLGVRSLRLGVEADGSTHRGAVSLAADRERERRTRWAFERATWWDVRRTPEQLRRRVLARAAALAAARGRS